MDTNLLIRDFAARIRTTQTLPVIHKSFGARPLIGSVDLPPPPPPEIIQPALPRVRVQRIDEMLHDAARAALARIEGKGRMVSAKHIQEAFESAVQRQCALILEASSKKNAIQRVVDHKIQLAAEATAKRKELAAELRASRRRARELKASILGLERDVARAQAFLRYGGRPYPEVPAAALRPNREGTGLPAEPGIYFLWSGGRVVYVGKSIRLCNRVKLGGHHVLNQGHEISYVVLGARELTWAECYYIGTLRPIANFGSMATHNRAGQ